MLPKWNLTVALHSPSVWFSEIMRLDFRKSNSFARIKVTCATINTPKDRRKTKHENVTREDDLTGDFRWKYRSTRFLFLFCLSSFCHLHPRDLPHSWVNSLSAHSPRVLLLGLVPAKVESSLKSNNRFAC